MDRKTVENVVLEGFFRSGDDDVISAGFPGVA